MIAKPLLLPKKLLIAMSGFSIAMVIGLFYSKMNDFPVEMKWIYITLIMVLIPFVVVMLDLIRNPIKNKIFWILVLCSVSIFAPFLYLIMRERTLMNSNLKDLNSNSKS